MKKILNTQTLMTSSAIFYGIGGVILSFLPQEILAFAQLDTNLSFILQLMGALFLSFAILNWMARATLVGGIYNRGIALSNFMHFFIGSTIWLKLFIKIMNNHYYLILGLIYGVFGVCFGYILFNSPKSVR